MNEQRAYELNDCDECEDFDWNEIVASLEDDDDADECAFDTADYATDEEAMAALEALMHSIYEEVMKRHETSKGKTDAPCA
jgi:hypothetical protein